MNSQQKYFESDPEVEYEEVTAGIKNFAPYQGEQICFKDCGSTNCKCKNGNPITFPNLINAPKHYDNSNGSLYKWCEEKGLNAWEFDIIKRVMRCRKKGQFIEDIDKTIELLKLYKNEYNAQS